MTSKLDKRAFVKRTGTLMFILLNLFANISCSQNKSTESSLEQTKANNLSILNHPHFQAFKSTLQKIIEDRAPDATSPQHFYIAKYHTDESITYMFWLEQKLLWIMTPGSDTEESWLGIRYPSSGQLLKLTDDVVNSNEELGTSTYLVNKDWAEEKLFQALILGDLVTMNED